MDYWENSGNDYKEPKGWFTVLSDSLVSFDDDENFQELDVGNLFFVDKNHGWVTGTLQRNGPDKAFATSTNNGGRNWKFNFIDEYTRSGDPYFFDMQTGIIAGNVIHRTTDGGSSWAHRMIRSGEPAVGVTTVEFQNESTGWATGPFGAIADEELFGILLQYPGTDGSVEDYSNLIEAAKQGQSIQTTLTIDKFWPAVSRVDDAYENN